MATEKAFKKAAKERVEAIAPKFEGLATSFQLLQETMKQHIEVVEKEKEEWEASKQLMKKMEFKDAEIISLNVGGQLFSTSIDTLRALVPYYDEAETEEEEEAEDVHLLSAMFSGNFELQKDKHGNIFLDRDPRLFGYILNFLRCQGRTEDFVPPKDKEKKQALIVEARFFNLRKLEHLLNGEYKGSVFFPGASITKTQGKLLNTWYGNPNQQWKLLYKASVHGRSSAQFHACCDNKGATISIIYSKSGNIYGGYSDKSWHSMAQYIHSNNTWMFSLASKSGTDKFLCSRPMYSVYGHASFGPCFGSDIGVDQTISHLHYYSPGSDYNVPNHMYFEIATPTNNQKPKIKDVEVFGLA